MSQAIEQNLSVKQELGFASLQELEEFAKDCQEVPNGDVALARILMYKLGRVGLTILDNDEELIDLDRFEARLPNGNELHGYLGPNVTEFAEDFIYDRRQLLDLPLDNRGEL